MLPTLLRQSSALPPSATSSSSVAVAATPRPVRSFIGVPDNPVPDVIQDCPHSVSSTISLPAPISLELDSHESPPVVDDMATEFAMPAPSTSLSTQYPITPASHYNVFNSQSQPISPMNSTHTTPHTSSPTSPRTGQPVPLPNQQLRPLKAPIYIPAVLRPTDPPRRVVRQSPLTPPQSVHNSYDDLYNQRPLSRTSTADSGKFGLGTSPDAAWSISGLSKVTDLPTKKHWKPDSEASICDEVSCTKPFSYFNRRHHCRRCGDIFCDVHSPHMVPLDQEANFHFFGTRSRACAHCHVEYTNWEQTRLSRSNSETSDDQTITPTTPVVNCASRSKSSIGSVFGPRKDGTPESMGQSVPRDWHWSTF